MAENKCNVIHQQVVALLQGKVKQERAHWALVKE
jgi:hypothetical protein